MSRIGKKAVPVPAGVTASVNGQLVSVKGPKGELKVVLNDQVLAKMEQGGIKVDPKDKSKLARSSWGMSRTLVANLVTHHCRTGNAATAACARRRPGISHHERERVEPVGSIERQRGNTVDHVVGNVLVLQRSSYAVMPQRWSPKALIALPRSNL